MDRISRRTFLRSSAALGGLTIITACAGPSATQTASPAASGASAAPTATPTPVKVKAAWVAMTSNQMLWPLAADAGYFGKYGVDLDLSYVNGSSTAVPALLSGELGAVSVAGSAVVSAQAGGQDVVMVAGFVNKAIFRVVSAAGINSIADLKGKSVAVTRIGNADYFAWQTIVTRNGMKMDDIKFVSANDVPGQVTLLKSGNVQAIAVSPPNNITALQAGGHEILDTATFDDPEQNVGIAVTREYLTKNRAAVTGIVKASIEAIARWKKDPAFAKGVIAKYLKNNDPQFLDVGYSAYVDVFPQAPYPSDAGVQKVIEEVTTQNPKAKDLKPAQLIDRSIVQELESSGFIAPLFK